MTNTAAKSLLKLEAIKIIQYGIAMRRIYIFLNGIDTLIILLSQSYTFYLYSGEIRKPPFLLDIR